MNNRDYNRIRSKLCGYGGLHCPCCGGSEARRARPGGGGGRIVDPAFNRRARRRIAAAFSRDLVRNPF